MPGIDRLLLTVGNGVHAARVHAERDEVGLGGLSPLLAEREVVLEGPALVGVALDRDDELRVRLEGLGQLIQGRLRFVREAVPIELEVDVPDG